MRIVQPRLIVAPESLYHADGWTVWHSGIADGPNDLQTTLEVIDTTGHARLQGPSWQRANRQGPPVEVTARHEGQEQARPSTSEYHSPQAYRLDIQFGRFGKRLGPRPEEGAVEITVDVHPLGIHVVRTLGSLPGADARDQAHDEPRLLAEPQILHHRDDWLLWHSGVVAGPAGLQAIFEILDTAGQDRIAAPAWDIPGMGTPPLDVTFSRGASSHPGVVTQASTPRSYTVGTYLEHVRTSTDQPVGDVTALVVAHPLNVSVRLTVPAR